MPHLDSTLLRRLFLYFLKLSHISAQHKNPQLKLFVVWKYTDSTLDRDRKQESWELRCLNFLHVSLVLVWSSSSALSGILWRKKIVQEKAEWKIAVCVKRLRGFRRGPQLFNSSPFKVQLRSVFIMTSSTPETESASYHQSVGKNLMIATWIKLHTQTMRCIGSLHFMTFQVQGIFLWISHICIGALFNLMLITSICQLLKRSGHQQVSTGGNQQSSEQD